jgi:hypothetical protein
VTRDIGGSASRASGVEEGVIWLREWRSREGARSRVRHFGASVSEVGTPSAWCHEVAKSDRAKSR